MFIRNLSFIVFLSIFVASSILLLFSLSSFIESSHYITIFVFFVILSYLKPKYAFIFLFFGLFLTGHQPYRTHTHYLIFIQLSILVGVYGRVFSNFEVLKAFVRRINSHPIFYFAVLYVVVGGIGIVFGQNGWFFQSSVHHGSIDLLRNIVSYGENHYLFSLQSYIYNVVSIALFVYLLGSLDENWQQDIKRYILAILTGFLTSIIIGYGDFFGLYNLNFFVQGEQRERFVSLYANSGWYAEYISMVLPLTLVLFVFLKEKVKKFIAFYLLLVVVCEVALILAMQRGGWVTYPFTLLVIWIAVYIAIEQHKNPKSEFSLFSFFRNYWFKVIVSIPVTIFLSVTIVYMLKSGNYIPSSAVSQVVNKAERVVDTHNRAWFWSPSLDLFSKHPIYGGGSDSFGWEYNNYFLNKTTPDFLENDHKIPLGASGTAHNLYLQNIVGKGIAGFILLLLILIYTLYKLYQAIFKSGCVNQKTYLGLGLIASIVSMMIYGNVQEIFYTQSLQIIFWAVIAFGAVLANSDNSQKGFGDFLNSKMLYLGALLLLLIPLHLSTITKDHTIKKVEEVLAYYNPSKKDVMLGAPAPSAEDVRNFLWSRKYQATLEEGINFKKEGYPNFLKYVGGMSSFERDFRWSDGKIVSFLFNDSLPDSFRLEIKTFAFGPNIKKPVKVIVGKQTKMFIPTEKFNVYNLKFSDVQANEIKIVVPNPASPKSVGVNEDTRTLGLAFKYIKIESK